MTRHLKILGLSLAAVFALSAVSASLASADVFKSEAETTTLTGTQVKHLEGGVEKFDRFKTDGGIVECTTATYSGTQTTKEAATVAVTPHYTGCTFAGLTAEIETNGCEYVFNLVGATTNGEVKVKCPAGKDITVQVGPVGTRRCTIHVPEQTLAGILFSILGATTTREVGVAVAATGLKYSQTAGTGSGACATADGKENGTYNGAAKVTGASGGAHVGVFLA